MSELRSFVQQTTLVWRAGVPALSRASLLTATLALLVPAAFDVARATDGSGRTPDALEGLAGDLHVTGMTFVGSRGDVTEFVLRAREALFRADTKMAELEDVRVNGSEHGTVEGFAVRCERGELDVETSDFLAEGNVRGTTTDGRSYRAPWVRYDHEQGLIYTDAPATMEDATGTFRGDGFRYHLKEGRFRLLGNVRVVQGR